MQQYFLIAVVIYAAFLLLDLVYFMIPAIGFGLGSYPIFLLLSLLVLLPLPMLLVYWKFKRYEKILSIVVTAFIIVALFISFIIIFSLP